MKIGTKERLLTIMVLALIGAIAALVWLTFTEVDVANRQRQQAGEIARGLSQLRLLTFEYRLHHDERTKAQWRTVSDRVDGLVKNARTSIPEQDQLLASIRNRRETIKRLFAELSSDPPGYRADAPLDPESRPFENLMIRRLLAVEQDNFTDVFRLNDIATDRIDDAQRHILSVAIVGLILIALATAFSSWIMNHNVLAPIARLQQAIMQVGAGNLKVKLESAGTDELGRLASSFNAMADRIDTQDTALRVARDELEQRVEERTAELAQLGAIVESSDDAIIGKTLDGTITSWNSGAEKMFGYARREAIGKPMLMIFPPERIDEERRIIADIAQGRRIDHFETVRVRKDGRRIDVAVNISPIKDRSGRIVGASKIARDITESKRAEEAVHAREAAERANSMKSEFLASMSHELRTPLNAIVGFTGTLLMKLPGPINADQERQLRTVQSSAKHLLALINDLLDVAKIGAGKLEAHFESVDCNRVVEDVAALLRPEATRKGLRFDVAVPDDHVVVWTDARALHQIILNLANNAVKFTDRGNVRIGIESRDVDGKRAVEISVEDSGKGIRVEDQAKLFEPFVQVDVSRHTPKEGTGLGLHLSRKLADLIGAHISLRSEYGKGSAFLLQLNQDAPPVRG